MLVAGMMFSKLMEEIKEDIGESGSDINKASLDGKKRKEELNTQGKVIRDAKIKQKRESDELEEEKRFKKAHTTVTDEAVQKHKSKANKGA